MKKHSIFFAALSGVFLLLDCAQVYAEALIYSDCRVVSMGSSSNHNDIYLIQSFAQQNPAVEGKILWGSGARVSFSCGDQAIHSVALSCTSAWKPDLARLDGAMRCSKQMERDFKVLFYALETKSLVEIRVDNYDNAGLNMCLAEAGCPREVLSYYTFSTRVAQ